MRLLILIATIFITTSCESQTVFGRIINYTPPAYPELVNANIVADGNSYFTTLFGYTPSPNVLMTLSPFATNGTDLSNFGVGSQTTGNMLSDQASQVLSLYNASVENILIFQEGGNDIYFNGDVSAAITRLTTYCNNATAAGFKVIVSTLIHRNQTTTFGDNASQYNTKIDNFNTALLALSGVYDAVIQPHLESIFSTYSSGGYHTDEVHPNQTGHNKYADLYLAAILSLY